MMFNWIQCVTYIMAPNPSTKPVIARIVFHGGQKKNETAMHIQMGVIMAPDWVKANSLRFWNPSDQRT